MLVGLLFREARILVQVMFLVRFAVGVVASTQTNEMITWRIGFGAFSWLCVTMAAYVMNGIADVEGDRKNGSKRPIAAGELSLSAACHAVFWLVVIGLVAAWAVSTEMCVAYLVQLTTAYFYSFGRWPLKNTIAGLLIGCPLAGLTTYAAGWCAAGAPPLTHELVIFGVALSMWMGLVGAATKDLGDLDGDRLSGRRTLPIVVGQRRARRDAAVVTAVFGLTFLLVATQLAASLVAAALVVAAGASVICGLLVRTGPAHGKLYDKGPYNAYMITQYFAHILVLVC